MHKKKGGLCLFGNKFTSSVKNTALSIRVARLASLGKYIINVTAIHGRVRGDLAPFLFPESKKDLVFLSEY